jgi:hypothetical protein
MFDTFRDLVEQYPEGTKFLLAGHNGHMAA